MAEITIYARQVDEGIELGTVPWTNSILVEKPLRYLSPQGMVACFNGQPVLFTHQELAQFPYLELAELFLPKISEEPPAPDEGDVVPGA